MSTQLHIIDALGPFFVNEPTRTTVNWSKVLFADLEVDGRLPQSAQKKILANFNVYLKKVASLGYDAISIDDLAHMVAMPFYNDRTTQLIADYQTLYGKIFTLAKSHDMHIYVNTDYLFSNDEIEDQLQSGREPAALFTDILAQAFKTFPLIDGIILRVGENDGKDVAGTFLSKLFLRTPKDANQLLQKILPLFETNGKQLIFRTWTVGAYKIGDLIWNEKTYNKVFKGISSPALIVSMKFGDTDFMRHLTLNPLFFHSKHKKILELQTRREWEGMGTIPSFVGWDYENYLRELQGNESFIGIHVWCQTGGWAKREWTNLTYLKNSSFWNELNTEVTIALAHTNMTTEQAISLFCESHNIKDVAKFIDLLKNAEIAIKKGFYISDLAVQTLYFRRTRIPPMLWITWDKIHLPALVIYLHRMLLPKHTAMVQDGDDAVAACSAMIATAKELQLDKQLISSLQFEKDTLLLLASLRRHIAGQLDENDIRMFNQSIKIYEQNHAQHYIFAVLGGTAERRFSKRLLSPFIRTVTPYRKRDRVFLKTSRMQATILRRYLKKSRSHLADQSMGIETLFK